MNYAIVAVPAAPVRRKSGHLNEMVNQLLFGEAVKILKTKGGLWVKIQSLHDGYIGWVTNTMLQTIQEDIANTLNSFVVSEILAPVLVDDKQMQIPMGSSLPFFELGKGVLGDSDYKYSGTFIKRTDQIPSTELITQLALAWLNAPYLWGGRTPLGVDCSGFVQVIYKLMGIDLPRDARQQAKVGVAIKNFEETRPGDLAFFERKNRIIHVGILLANNQIIHASGKVKIDIITEKGIINSETEKKILKLRSIKRIW